MSALSWIRAVPIGALFVAGAAHASAPPSLPETLAGLVATHVPPSWPELVPDSSLFDVPKIGRVALTRLRGHLDAWTMRVHGQGLSAADFGPAGAVRTVDGQPAESDERVPVWRIVGGPLAGCVLLPDQWRSGFEIGTVSYYEQIHSALMGELCNWGAIPGIQKGFTDRFRDACLAEVARRMKQPVGQLFSFVDRTESPLTTRNCDERLSGINRPLLGWRWSCRITAATGKLLVDVHRH
jgi:hypothetical protein